MDPISKQFKIGLIALTIVQFFFKTGRHQLNIQKTRESARPLVSLIYETLNDEFTDTHQQLLSQFDEDLASHTSDLSINTKLIFSEHFLDNKERFSE